MRSSLPLVAVLLAGSIAYGQPGAPAPAPTPVRNEPGPTAPGIGGSQPVNGPLQLTPKELEELKDFEKEYDNFQEAANSNDKRLREMAKREFDSRTGELEKRYAERIAKTETD